MSWPRNSASKVQPNLFCFLELLKARKFDLGFFNLGGLLLVQGFFGFYWKPKGFFCSHTIIPVT